MFARILKHEWRLLATDGSLWLVVGIFAVAIAYGTFNGARWVRFQHTAIAETAREEAERFAAQEAAIARLTRGELKLSPFADPRNPQTAGGRLGARYAVMPPSPLAALSIGQSDLLPYYVKVTTDSKETITGGAEIENPQRLLTGRIDLAFVIIYLYPLLVLAFSYNLLSAEKEQGTLALTVSQPVSLARIAIGKLTVRFGVFVVTLAVLAGVAALVAGIDVRAEGAVVRAVLWLVAVAAYGLVWFALAVGVASFGRPSATNAIVLASTWLALVVLIPSLLNIGAATAYPVPSRVEMIQAMREASDEANRQGAALLARYYDDHPELAAGSAERAMNDFYAIRVAVTADVESRVRPVLDRYERQLSAQQRVVARLRILSPAILMQEALNDLAGTSAVRHQHFLAQVGHFHAQWRDHFVPMILRKEQLGGYADLPRFVFRDEPTGAVLSRVAASVGLMLCPVVLLGAAGLRRLRNFPVASW